MKVIEVRLEDWQAEVLRAAGFAEVRGESSEAHAATALLEQALRRQIKRACRRLLRNRGTASSMENRLVDLLGL
jgi:hypothetical protein